MNTRHVTLRTALAAVTLVVAIAGCAGGVTGPRTVEDVAAAFLTAVCQGDIDAAQQLSWSSQDNGPAEVELLVYAHTSRFVDCTVDSATARPGAAEDRVEVQLAVTHAGALQEEIDIVVLDTDQALSAGLGDRVASLMLIAWWWRRGCAPVVWRGRWVGGGG